MILKPQKYGRMILKPQKYGKQLSGKILAEWHSRVTTKMVKLAQIQYLS